MTNLWNYSIPKLLDTLLIGCRDKDENVRLASGECLGELGAVEPSLLPRRIQSKGSKIQALSYFILFFSFKYFDNLSSGSRFVSSRQIEVHIWNERGVRMSRPRLPCSGVSVAKKYSKHGLLCSRYSGSKEKKNIGFNEWFMKSLKNLSISYFSFRFIS